MTKLKAFWFEARKTAAALVTGTILWGTQVLASEPKAITGGEWIGLATVFAVGLGVYTVENKPA